MPDSRLLMNSAEPKIDDLKKEKQKKNLRIIAYLLIEIETKEKIIENRKNKPKNKNSIVV